MSNTPDAWSGAGVLGAGSGAGAPADPPAGSAEDAVCASYRQGLTMEECAARHGLTMKVVRRILDRNAVPRRRPGRRPGTPYREQDLIAALRAGPVTGTQIADRFGISGSTVRRVRCGIAPEDKTFIRPGEAARLLGVGLRQVPGLAARGQLSEGRTPGGKRRYLRAEIQALASRRGNRTGTVAAARSSGAARDQVSVGRRTVPDLCDSGFPCA